MPTSVYTPNHLLPAGPWMVSPIGSRSSGLIMGSDFPVMTTSSPLMNRPNGCDGFEIPLTGELFDQVENAGIALPDSQGRTSSKSQHMCNYCGKLYSRRYGLKIHLRTHSGYKPLKCSYCPRTFSDPSNLNKHTKLHFNHDATKYGMRKVPRLSAPPDEQNLFGAESELMESFAPLPQSSPEPVSVENVKNVTLSLSNFEVGQDDTEEEAVVIIDDAEERGANVSHEDHKEGCKLVEKAVEHEESLDCPAGGFKNPETILTYSSHVEKVIRPISNVFSVDGLHNQYFTTDEPEDDCEDFRSPVEQFQELPDNADDDGSSYASLISYIPPSDVTETETEHHVFHKTEPCNIFLSSTQDFQCQDDSNGTSLYDMPWFFDDNANCTFTNYNTSSLDQQNCFNGFPNTSGEFLARCSPKGAQAMIAEMPTTLSDSATAVMTSSVDDYYQHFLLTNQKQDVLSNQASEDIFQVEKDAIEDYVDFAGLLLPPQPLAQNSEPTNSYNPLQNQ